MNPYDLRTVFLAKHAQHVVLIHFPIALCLIGIAFDFLARWTGKAELEEVAYYNLLVAAISTVPVIVTGLLAWRWQLEGQRLKGILLQHMALGILSSTLIWLIWWLHVQTRRKPGHDLPRYRLPSPARVSTTPAKSQPGRSPGLPCDVARLTSARFNEIAVTRTVTSSGAAAANSTGFRPSPCGLDGSTTTARTVSGMGLSSSQVGAQRR